MKNTIQHIFRNSYLAMCMMLLSATAFGQSENYDSTKVIQQINAAGYDYKVIVLRNGGMFRIPRNCPAQLAYRDSGALCWKNNALNAWTGTAWSPVGSAGAVLKDTAAAGYLFNIDLSLIHI